MRTWPDTVPLHADGGATDHNTMNAPIQALIDRTDYLKDMIDQLATGKRMQTYCDKLLATTAVGDAVYFNTVTGQFEPALAKFQAVYAADGSLMPAESALVLGFVLSKDTTTSGDIALYGEVDDDTFITAVFGATPVAGLYWLSPTVAGEVTQTEPPVKCPCIFYTYDGRCLVLQGRPWFPNHIHKSFMLTEAWLAASDPAFASMTVPVGAVYGYDIASDYDLSSLWALFPGAVKLSADGTIIYASDFVCNDDNIWWIGAGDPNAFTDVECYALIPFSYGEPILRGALSTHPDDIAVSALQGMLTIDPKAWASDGALQNGYAISQVVEKKYKSTPVIATLAAGPGAAVSVNLATGAAVVSQDRLIGALVDADLVDLSNAVEVADSPYVYYSLPANRAAYIVGEIPVTKMSGATFAAAAWMYAKGILGGTVPTPISFPALTVTMTFVPSPKTPGYIDYSSVTSITTTIPAFNSVQTRLYYKETTAGDRLTVTGEGTLYVKIEAASDAYDKDILRFGAIIYVI